MATLNTIAKDFASVIRGGRDWVLVWTDAKGWHAQAFAIPAGRATFDPADTQRIREIARQDRNAVLLNGRWSSHFGEWMNVADVAEGIRWHYEDKLKTPLSRLY